jgi:hypothetical protein
VSESAQKVVLTTGLVVRVEPFPYPLLAGGAFYQLEEDALYVQVGAPEQRFFSYIESDGVRLDMDREGRLLFIEVAIPRRRWWISDTIEWPDQSFPADMRWLNFRSEIATPSLFTNRKRNMLAIRFSPNDAVSCWALSHAVVSLVDAGGAVAQLLIRDIVDDVAGQEIAAFRRTHRAGPSSAEQYLQPHV